MEAAEAVHQGVGDRVGVPTGDGVVQQQLQHLVVGKGVNAVFPELPPPAFPVPAVVGHAPRLPSEKQPLRRPAPEIKCCLVIVTHKHLFHKGFWPGNFGLPGFARILPASFGKKVDSPARWGII